VIINLHHLPGGVKNNQAFGEGCVVGHGRSLGARVLEPRAMLEPRSISERISA
jgi:hypothetical protein